MTAFEAAHFAELVRLRFEHVRTHLALEIPCGNGCRITIAPRYYLRDDGKHCELQRVYTGGLNVIGTIADPRHLLHDIERRRLVRIKAGWKVTRIVATLTNMHAHLVKVEALQRARAEVAVLRSDQAHAASQ